MNFFKKSYLILITGSLFFSLLTGNDTTFSNCMAFCLESYDHNYPSYQESIFDTKQHLGNTQLTFDMMYSNASLFPASQASSALNFPGLWVGDTYVTATAAFAAYKQGFVPPHDRAFKQLIEAIAAYEEERLADQRMLDEMALAKKAWEYNQKMAADQARQRVITDHLKQYGVSYEYLWAKKTGLYRLNDFDQVVHRILAMTDITHAQAYAIIKGYCDKRCFHKDEKRYSKYVINQAFKHRERLKAQQQREDQLRKEVAIQREADEKLRQKQQVLHEQQQALRQQQKVLATYRPVLDFCASHTDTAVSAVGIATYQTQRQQALDQTVADGGKQHVKSYELDACTQGFLLQHEINPNQFQSLSSTIFGHQLFSEFEQLYKKIAKTTFECLLKSELVDDCVGFAQLGFEATQQEQFVLAATLSDFANTLTDCSFSVFCKGPIAAICGIIDICRNPEPLLEGMGKLLVLLGGALNRYDNETAPLGSIQMHYCQEAHERNVQEFNQMCDLAKQHFYHWKQTSSPPEKCEAISTFVCDGLVATPLLGKTMRCCGKMLVKAHELVMLEKVAAVAQDLGVELQEAQRILVATEGVLQSVPANAAEVETALTCLMESELNTALVGVKSTAMQIIEPFFEKFKACKGIISLEDKLFKEEFKRALKILEEALKSPEFAKIKRLYGQRIINGQQVRARLDHICYFELGLEKSTQTAGFVLQVEGGHLSGICEALAETGLINIVNKDPVLNGVVRYILEDALTKQVIYKTISPNTWTLEKIGKVMWDVFETGEDIFTQNGWFKYKIVDGVEISLCIRTIKGQKGGKDILEIITLLPYKIGSR